MEEEEEEMGSPGFAVKPPRLLLLNLDPSMTDFLAQVDEVCPTGSTVTLFCPERPDSMPRMSRASLEWVEGDPNSPSQLQALGAHEYDAVICLQPGKGSEKDDSSLLLTLLSLEQAADAVGAKVPRVVGEVHSPDMVELIGSRWPELNKAWDFVLPNELCSGILVQFALQPELRSVYSELLQPDGKEIYLQPAQLYAPPKQAGKKRADPTFDALGLEARKRGEVAIGVHRAGEDRPVLNPPRREPMKLQQGDKLIVIGDAF